ncbi:MAG: hypothetical protein RMJ33_13900 [Saprospiraceae bacterium]|nr:hypothetical protein [Saprospiraceae bacterium]
MVIKNVRRQSEAKPTPEVEERGTTTRFKVRWATGEGKFEWSDTDLPDLDADELNLLKQSRISLHVARVVKRMRLERLPLKQIIFNLRARKGFSPSTVSKAHALLARANKSKK